MLGILGIIALLVILGVSLLITKIAATALRMTGMSDQSARFQARSAFTGVGFTTSESENVVDHPVRRRVVMGLMVVRSAGLITILLSLILSFVSTGAGPDRLERLLWLVGGVAVLWTLASLGWLDRLIERWVQRSLARLTDLDARDYYGLLKLHGDYTVNELQVQEGDWLQDKTLRDCKLTDEGVLVLGIVREDGRYVGAPRPDTSIRAHNTLILYGRQEVLSELDERRAGASGEEAHRQARDAQRREEEKQEREDRESEERRQREETGRSGS